MKRRVVLYNPYAEFHTMPLALLAIASHLDRDRYEPIIVDARLESDPAGTVLRAAEDAVCLGVTVLTGAPIRDAVRVSRAVKARYPTLPVVWGGWHPSMFGADCLEESSVDITVQGQGESTFREIVDRLARGESLEGCLGARTANATAASPRTPPARSTMSTRCAPRLLVDRRRRVFPAQDQTTVRLYHLAGLPIPLRVLRRPVRLQAPVGGARARARGR
jgi:radical SAM superfamily enzyme YgiQ (UPF0313 family)